MIYKYPYTNLYNLNLDWIIQAIKEVQEIIGPLDRVVNSVNGMTGDVEITKALLTQILGGLVETFNGRSGDVELTAGDVNATLIDITWTSDPGETINNLSQSELDEMYISGKRVLIFVNNQSVADRVYFLQYYNNHAQPQEYTPTSALAGVVSFNGQTGNVTVTGADLQTSATETRTIADSLAMLDVSKVPATRTINGKYLSANITLNDEDIPSTVDGQTTVEGVLAAQSQKINTLGPVNNVSSDSSTAALAAAQGKALSQRITTLNEATPKLENVAIGATITERDGFTFVAWLGWNGMKIACANPSLPFIVNPNHLYAIEIRNNIASIYNLTNGNTESLVGNIGTFNVDSNGNITINLSQASSLGNNIPCVFYGDVTIKRVS